MSANTGCVRVRAGSQSFRAGGGPFLEVLRVPVLGPALEASWMPFLFHPPEGQRWDQNDRYFQNTFSSTSSTERWLKVSAPSQPPAPGPACPLPAPRLYQQRPEARASRSPAFSHLILISWMFQSRISVQALVAPCRPWRHSKMSPQACGPPEPSPSNYQWVPVTIQRVPVTIQRVPVTIQRVPVPQGRMRNGCVWWPEEPACFQGEPAQWRRRGQGD